MKIERNISVKLAVRLKTFSEDSINTYTYKVIVISFSSGSNSNNSSHIVKSAYVCCCVVLRACLLCSCADRLYVGTTQATQTHISSD